MFPSAAREPHQSSSAAVMRLKHLVKASVMQGRTLDQRPRTTQRSRRLPFAAHFVDQPCVFLAVVEVMA